MIHGRFLVKARKLGVLVMMFIALAAILRASGVDDPCCDRTAAIIMQCSLVRQTCPDDGMVMLDAANAQRLTDAYICGVCAGYDKNDPLSDCICSPRAADMLWRNFYAKDRKPDMANRRPHRQRTSYTISIKNAASLVGTSPKTFQRRLNENPDLVRLMREPVLKVCMAAVKDWWTAYETNIAIARREVRAMNRPLHLE